LFHTVGGCPVLDERQIEGRLDESLSGVLSGLVADGRRRERIAYTLRRLGRPDATESVSSILFDLLGISTRPAGDWSIFRREDVFGGRASTENMDLSPMSGCRRVRIDPIEACAYDRGPLIGRSEQGHGGPPAQRG
jgi:hypothetical protein